MLSNYLYVKIGIKFEFYDLELVTLHTTLDILSLNSKF